MARLLLILLSATLITICKACADICINWKISNNSLVITCKIPQLIFGVQMTDPHGIEQGFCALPYPVPSCHAIYSNGSLTQNISSRETVLKVTGNLDQWVNGFWTCFHGRFVKNASVEVTIPEPQCGATCNTKVTRECWFLLSHWTLLSSFTSFMIIYWIHLLIPYVSKEDTDVHCLFGVRHYVEQMLARKNNQEFQTWRYVTVRHINTFKFTITILLAILVVILPAIIGFTDKQPCRGYYLFIAFGTVVGITYSVIQLLFNGIVRDLEAANKSEDQPINTENSHSDRTNSEVNMKMLATSTNLQEKTKRNQLVDRG